MRRQPRKRATGTARRKGFPNALPAAGGSPASIESEMI
jgi:hypothetical protein